MKMLFAILVSALASWAPAASAAPMFAGDVPVEQTISIGDFQWVWASPCEGNGSGCAEAVTLHDDWRFPTTFEYDSMLASAAELLAAGNRCGAGWFQGNWSHCDFTDDLWRADSPSTNGTFGDTLLIRSQANQVPEPATLLLTGIAFLGWRVSRRRA